MAWARSTQNAGHVRTGTNYSMQLGYRPVYVETFHCIQQYVCFFLVREAAGDISQASVEDFGVENAHFRAVLVGTFTLIGLAEDHRTLPCCVSFDKIEVYTRSDTHLRGVFQFVVLRLSLEPHRSPLQESADPV